MKRDMPVSPDEIRQIGIQLASIWGGEFINYFLDSKAHQIVFHCIEHGEEFVTILTYDEFWEELNELRGLS